MSSNSDLKALYPFLHGAPQDADKLHAALMLSGRDRRERNLLRYASAEEGVS